MTSRLRGPSAVKDTPRAASFAKDHFHRSEPEVHSGRCKNDGRDNRYHFGMTKLHDNNKVERNGREYNKNAQTEENSVDLLYKKSREHFGTWDIKDIVQDDMRKSRKQDLEDTQLTNGKFRGEPACAKLDKPHDRPEYRDEGYVGSLPREGRQRIESVERELNGSHKSRIKEPWEDEMETRNRGRTSKISKSNGSNHDAIQPVDERDILLKEIEHLATDGSQSPDRRIQAMIDRLKSREESKLRSGREQRSASPEKEMHGTTKSDGRGDLRSPVINSYPFDNLSNDRDRKLRDDGESKPHGKPDREEDAGQRDRSVDRKSRSTERFQRDGSFRKTSGTYNAEKNYTRRSIEDEDNHPRSRGNSSKRRSYTYEGSPEDFDVRIQRYDRALLEPRRDLDRSSPGRSSPRRSSSREPHLVRKESLKDQEPVTKKNSFRAESRRATSKDRGESNLIRKTSFKDRDNDTYKRYVAKNQHQASVRYFGKDEEDLSCQDSFKDVNASRKGFFKIRDSELDGTFLKDQNDNAERKISSMKHAGGVSRIVLRNVDDESSRSNSFKNANEDSGKKNSFKEKNAEFGETFYKDRESNSERRKNSFKDDDKEFGRTSYHDYENNIDRKTANDRYIEFGKVSFQTQDDEPRVSSPFKEKSNDAIIRTNSFKEHDASPKRRASLRGRDREGSERKLEDGQSRALSPLKKSEPAESNSSSKGAKNFCAKSWYENNRIFSAKYLRDHSKLRNSPEGRLNVDISPERGFLILQDTQGGTVEASANDPEGSPRFETRGRMDGESPRFSSTRDRNGATIIRIRSSEDASGGSAERRGRRRRPAQEICAARRRKYEDDDEDSDEDEEEDRWRRTPRRDGGVLPGRGGNAGGATPSRTVWNYREGVWHFHESIAFDRSFMVQRREAVFINRWRR
ncbi:eukaryotic translation initiation factor 3 subunit A-like [Monomorium pharaonis]|uniref:eukaryotic translation initiation factor 3 subunit A-like n=1 Tax=Monomorium pharaonis TaxID=307658 RepID=UPI0017462F79|nr:eukaryotic translation initiation factor 3 subunit A-like [Monomorium pharaonis]